MGLAALVAGALAGVLLVWVSAPVSGQVEHVILPQGAVLRVANYSSPMAVDFEVAAPGAVLVGAVHGDHSALFGDFSSSVFFHCPAEPVPPVHTGGPWNESFDRKLSPGEYFFGEGCLSPANITVTETVELLSEGVGFSL